MNVRELIEILQRCDPEMEVATHALNHTQIDRGRARVVLMSTYDGPRVGIGDFSKRDINAPNWFVIREVDGGSVIPDHWEPYGEHRQLFEEQNERASAAMQRTLCARGHDQLLTSVKP